MSHYDDGEDLEDFSASGDEAKEASFYFFTKDLSYYLKSGKYGPLIWKELDEEAQQIVRNIVQLDLMGCDNLNEWKPPV